MSNGIGVAFEGYALVCLSTMHFFVGSDLASRGMIRPIRRPVCLLSDFIVLDMYEKKKDEKKKDEKKHNHNNNENDPKKSKKKKKI